MKLSAMEKADRKTYLGMMASKNGQVFTHKDLGFTRVGYLTM